MLFDIETAPNVIYAWGRWEQDAIGMLKDWHMLCFAWKWLGEKKVYSSVRAKNGDDKAVAQQLHKLFEEADIIIAHNGDQFDMKKARTRFIVNGLKPVSPSKTVDTKKVASRIFGFDSNKLDELARQLGLPRKLDPGGFKTWLGCMSGDKKAWAHMEKYNRYDVVLLEQIYLKLRSWDTQHPNVNVYTGKDGCPTCHSPKLQRRGFSITPTGRKQRFQCQNPQCGRWSVGPAEKVDTIVAR